MNNFQFKSVYKTKMEEYILMKRNLGYTFETLCSILRGIDSLAFETNQKKTGFTKKFYKKYLICKPDETKHYQYTRIMVLRRFSQYLLDMGIPSFIPPRPRYVKNGHIPFIYTEKQLNSIFEYSNNMSNIQEHTDTNLYCFPAIVRLLYSTGIRIGEALALKDGDVFLKEKYILIRKSKNGKERILPISESLAKVLLDYEDYKKKLPIQNQQGFFFVKPDGKRPAHIGISERFRECLNSVKILGDDKSIRPRLHDLRHTFAVNALVKLAKMETDLYLTLPILSQYLGHSSIKSTNHYVRLTANMYPELLKEIDLLTLTIFPKNKSNEEND